MAVLSHLASFFSFVSNKPFAASLPSCKIGPGIHHRRQLNNRPPAILATSIKKPRASRKGRSDADLCRDIREFVSAFGLPDDHVPSLKELSQYGRQDLANIVRRRGYKLIKDLLETSAKSDEKESDTEPGLSGNQDVSVECQYDSAGLDKKVEQMDEVVFSSSEAPVNQNHVASANEASMDCVVNSDSNGCKAIESSANSSLHEKAANFIENGELDPIEGQNLTLQETTRAKLKCNIEAQSILRIVHSYRGLSKGSPSRAGSAESIAESHLLFADDLIVLEEEGFLFYQFKIGPIDCFVYSPPSEEGFNTMLWKSEDGFGILHEIGADGGNKLVELENIKNACSSLTEERSEWVLHRGDTDKLINGIISSSKQVVVPVSGTNTPRNSNLLGAGVLSMGSEEELDDQTIERENQIEVNRLKFLLHQKELELSQLKEQIEKEKLALSNLQTKAETEISKAQKLVMEKDAELHATEENLAGLVEVEIQYEGDGEAVEVAGSFSGWHHHFAMDPLPSSSITDPIGSRKSRLWTTALWLYPGTYEIKFIVDGNWRIDPQRESVTKGTIENNILRVDIPPP